MSGTFASIGTLVSAKDLLGTETGIQMTPGLVYEFTSASQIILTVPYGAQKSISGDCIVLANTSLWHFAKEGRHIIDVIDNPGSLIMMREYIPFYGDSK